MAKNNKGSDGARRVSIRNYAYKKTQYGGLGFDRAAAK